MVTRWIRLFFLVISPISLYIFASRIPKNYKSSKIERVRERGKKLTRGFLIPKKRARENPFCSDKFRQEKWQRRTKTATMVFWRRWEISLSRCRIFFLKVSSSSFFLSFWVLRAQVNENKANSSFFFFCVVSFTCFLYSFCHIALFLCVTSLCKVCLVTLAYQVDFWWCCFRYLWSWSYSWSWEQPRREERNQ